MGRAIRQYAKQLLALTVTGVMVVLLSCTTSTQAPTEEEGRFFFAGKIESVSINAWVVGGRTFKVDNDTKLDEGLDVGVLAEVEFDIMPDGAMLASKIENEGEFSYYGIVKSIGTNAWVVGKARTFKVDRHTRIDAGLDVGVLAEVEFDIMPDGSMLAIEIETEAPDTVLQDRP